MTKIKEKQEVSGAVSLTQAIDRFKRLLADDINKVCDLKDNLLVLSSNSDGQVLNRILKIITMFDAGKEIPAKLKKELLPNVFDGMEETKKLNIQDFVLENDEGRK